MTYASEFTAHFLANQKLIPASIAAQIKREAKARLIERWSAGRADCVLDFSDLVMRIEDAMDPKRLAA